MVQFCVESFHLIYSTSEVNGKYHNIQAQECNTGVNMPDKNLSSFLIHSQFLHLVTPKLLLEGPDLKSSPNFIYHYHYYAVIDIILY